MVIIKCVWLSIAVACLDVVLAILGRTLACMRHPTLVYSSSYIFIMTLGQLSPHPHNIEKPFCHPQRRFEFVMAVLTIFAILVGVIVFFMLVAGVVGLVKARNNRARYGPRAAAPGRPRQTRTKGIALAVLDSIPIVKFGAKSKQSDVVPKDVELGERKSTVNEEPTIASEARATRKLDEDERVESINIDQSSKIAFQATVDENQCAICISDFVADEEVRVLPCNHRYHPECIDPWLLNISGTCPICRYDLRPNDPNAENTEDISIPEQPYVPVSSPIGYIRAEALRQEAARLEAFANPIDATTPAASPISPRERMSIRSRLREIRQASHTGPEYVAALGNFYRDRENRRPSMEAQRVAL
ncbi:E3 ubiquitin-protein ligase rnf13 [Cadophora gregata]|uniref:E3 ubiquitin-protein ligase rnf13 n=1 Tax=Cadophora gregata TaxID=51156 RepID=UPI0026DB91A2|nr:E3 ubiquitin-protein ligase rnf13 [Cadophora gregata]KAK0125864.1 E3 ubiquitin-protein ligase rnf13 [Cadophora gregata]